MKLQGDAGEPVDDLHLRRWRRRAAGTLAPHDTSATPAHFGARSHPGPEEPGVLLTLQKADVGDVIEWLLIIWSASPEEDWIDQIHYLPSLSRWPPASIHSRPKLYPTLTEYRGAQLLPNRWKLGV